MTNMCFYFCLVFFFKQKTAYEMRISDWSSDVCSSDLGRLSDNPDIKRYRGNTGLFAEIGEGDGLRITTNTRFNFGSGKGAIDADISYPIDRLIGGNLNFYLIGQAFTGYGGNLSDYNSHMTRLRNGRAPGRERGWQ